MTNVCNFYHITSKLHHQKKTLLIIILKINKNLQIRFYSTFLVLNLTIYLKIKTGENFLINTKKIAK